MSGLTQRLAEFIAGYQAADVPATVAAIVKRSVLDGLGVDKAHVVGLSMGAFATLHFGMQYPERALSITTAGVGSGAPPADYAKFQADSQANAKRILEKGMGEFAATYGHGPARVQLRRKDPRGFAEFVRHLAEHSAKGSANTMLGYQARRPSLWDLEGRLRALRVPTLIVAGDEDEPTLEASLYLKRMIPRAGFAMLPRTGHLMNLEEPALFNRLVEDFLHEVERSRWE
jgi:pimeloyl-ACP methyl ester carboxylesterase